MQHEAWQSMPIGYESESNRTVDIPLIAPKKGCVGQDSNARQLHQTMEMEQLPQLPATEARLNATTNLEESDRYWDEVSPKFCFVVVLIQPKSDTWFLLFAKAFWDRTV
jgi:hypothetical protein